MLHQRSRARPLAACGYTVCRVEFVFPRRRLTHLCRKPLVPRWRLHMCVRSRASAQNSGSCRSLRPNWLLNSTGLVDVPDKPVTEPAGPRPLTRDCGRRANELEKHRVAHFTSTLMRQPTALLSIGRGFPGGFPSCAKAPRARLLGLGESPWRADDVSMVAVCAILSHRVVQLPTSTVCSS